MQQKEGEDRGSNDIKEMTTAGEIRGEWWEDFNEKGNMLCNERECKRKKKGKRHTEKTRGKIQNQGQP